jgi:hypothetical protein
VAAQELDDALAALGRRSETTAFEGFCIIPLWFDLIWKMLTVFGALCNIRLTPEANPETSP